MRTRQDVEAKAQPFALPVTVEAGKEIAITRHGKVVVRRVPDSPRLAAELFRPLWAEGDINLEAPQDAPPEPTPELV